MSEGTAFCNHTAHWFETPEDEMAYEKEHGGVHVPKEGYLPEFCEEEGGKAMKWQPIETAPRDGTKVLLADGMWGPYVGWWGTHDAAPNDWWFVDPDLSGDKLNSWRRGYGPTHWMPVPEPPEEEE